ncbi:autophagy-related protein 22-like protein, partial [Obelidium mucronatum]
MSDIEKKDVEQAVEVKDTDYNPDAIADPVKYMRGVAVVSVYELWAYYLFYNGDNGGGPNGQMGGMVGAMINKNANANFIAHNATLPADKAYASDATCGGADTPACMVGYGSSTIPQVSFTLLQTGITQLVAAIVLITLGGLGDYKLYGRNILMFATIACILLHFSFAFVNVSTGSFAVAVTLLFFTVLTYQMTLSFFFAAFPRLASHMPSVYEKIDAGATVKEVDDEIALQRSRISMVSTYWSNIGWAVPLLIFLGIIYLYNPEPEVSQIDWTFNANAILFGTYWLIFAIPYFILDKKRPGPDIPEGVNVFTEGLVQAREALRLSKKLPNVWWYMLGFFLYTDGINSAGTILGGYLQGLYFHYNLLQNNLLGLAQAVSSMIGCLIFWKVQQHFKLQTKTMLQTSNLLTIIMYGWGIIGLFSKTVGYRSNGEFWFYNIGYGLWTAPFWALQNSYLSDLIPASKAYLFFALFGIMSKCSSFIGPLVNFIITMIAPTTDADYIGFIPCTIISLIGFVIMQKTDPIQARADVIAFEQAERELKA